MVESLVNDHSLRVRMAAATAVGASYDHSPQLTLDLTEDLFQTIEVLNGDATERLLGWAFLDSPDRFTPVLARALDSKAPIARRAGRIWATGFLQEKLPDGSHDIQRLSVSARLGAAETLAANITKSHKVLPSLFDDDDPDVQQKASLAMGQLGKLSPSHQDRLFDAFAKSKAFPQRMNYLFVTLQDGPKRLPKNTIAACERAIEIAGHQLGDLTTSHSGLGSVHDRRSAASLQRKRHRSQKPMP